MVTDEGVEELVLWPDILRAEVADGKVQIVDEDGTLVAVEGDRIFVPGGSSVPGVFEDHTGAPPRRCGNSLWYAAMPIERVHDAPD